MLDARTGRTRVTTAALPRATRHGAGAGREPRSTAEPCPLWSTESSVINILPLKTQVKYWRTSPPAGDHPFKLEVTFCVRGVMSPIRAIIRLKTVFPEGWHLRADLIPRLETGNLENGNWKSEGRVVPLQPGARLCPPNTRLPKLSLYGFFLAAGFFTPAFTGFFSPPLRLISAKKSLALNG